MFRTKIYGVTLTSNVLFLVYFWSRQKIPLENAIQQLSFLHRGEAVLRKHKRGKRKKEL